MDEMMKLVIGWTIVVAFVFTTIVTCMSLVGWIKFASKKQQQGLYAALILELVVGGAGKLTGNMSYSPDETGEILRSEGATGLIEAELDAAGRAPAGSNAAIDRETLERLVGHINPVQGSKVAERKAGLLTEIRNLPAGRLSPEGIQRLRTAATLTPRRP